MWRLGRVQWPAPVAGSLSGVNVLATGVFETIHREDLMDLLQDCGAHYYSGPSPYLDYLLVGRDEGPFKVRVAQTYGTPMLNEQQTLDWIRSATRAAGGRRSSGGQGGYGYGGYYAY